MQHNYNIVFDTIQKKYNDEKIYYVKKNAK